MKKNKEKHYDDNSGKDPLQTYLSHISEFQLLDKEEEWKLAKRIQEGDQQALHELVNANLRFVVSISKKYIGCGIPLLDLINEGNVGLMEAAKRFDPAFKVKFISYAVWWIKQSIMQILAEQGSTVRIPLKKASLIFRIGEKFKELCQTLQREPTSEEIAKELNLSQRDIDLIMRAARTSISFDARDEQNENLNPMDVMEDSGTYPILENLEIASNVEEIKKLVDKLPNREAEILKLHFGLDGYKTYTLDEIGRKKGLTRERVRQLEIRAKKILYQYLLEQSKNKLE